MSDAPKISEAPPKKRLALFLDGTWNTVGDNTNVWRMRSLCARRGTDNVAQSIYYDTGIGTAFGEQLLGGWFGYGISRNITQAYEWLIESYNEGDEIFIFGFSRGAFTARSLAGFIAKCGLLKPGAALGVGQLYNRYRRENDRTLWSICDARANDPNAECTFEELWMLKYSMPVKIKFVAVWDTVGAIGVPAFNIPGISRSRFTFLHTGLRTPVEHGFHALAIDEHRRAFSPTLWTIRRPKDAKTDTGPARPITSVEQRWFVGAHANVGGGCESDLLAQVPLRWIMSKASQHGLGFRSDVEIDGDLFTAPVSDSYKEFMRGIYSKFSWRRHRELGADPAERDGGVHRNVNETIDASVFERWRKDSKYRPPNLEAWAKKYKVDMNKINYSVYAHNPQVAAPN